MPTFYNNVRHAYEPFSQLGLTIWCALNMMSMVCNKILLSYFNHPFLCLISFFRCIDYIMLHLPKASINSTWWRNHSIPTGWLHPFTDWLAYVSGNIWMSDYLQTIYKRIDPQGMSCRQFIQGLSKSYVTVVKNKTKCNSQCKTRKLVMKKNIGIFNELILFIYLILMLFYYIKYYKFKCKVDVTLQHAVWYIWNVTFSLRSMQRMCQLSTFGTYLHFILWVLI